ncbi:uncharacterized protein MKZ38_004012 [Zalerion maritima]|uniref:polynucleotide adenylyltransferase n=1 Tax=Zalerion maritima TaxID=339359 RepID=A0AAD5WRY4_9PEZI|nr:uncharacterized protein MKZ38_004012 [Zalerion maritima]
MWSSFDTLRSQHDKTHGIWPPHINIVYPFVNPDALPRAAEAISTSRSQSADEPLSVQLDSAGVFEQKFNNIVFAHDSNKDHTALLDKLQRSILASLGHKANKFNHHLTLGHTDDINGDKHKFLVSKVELLPRKGWVADKLYLLQREQIQQMGGTVSSRMRVWGTIDAKTGKVERHAKPLDFDDIERIGSETNTSSCKPSYQYSPKSFRWTPYKQLSNDALPSAKNMPNNMAVGSYNVLAEFQHPPSQARYPLILDNLFVKPALSDVLVLQEVSDDFLSFLLQDDRIRESFPYASHGPPEQEDVNPLPNHVNIVVLSRFPFSWNWVPLKRRYKGSLIATFPTLGKLVETGGGGKDFIPLILSTVHLTCGLTDAAVVSKKAELKELLSHLESVYPGNPWILAGDFNMSTSSYSISNLVNNKSIESKTASALAGLDSMLADARLSDTWMVAHLERAHVAESDDEESEKEKSDGNHVYRGEQGATYDPLKNPLAMDTVGQGFNCRPQRYDRILVRSEGLFNVIGFSRFGFLTKEDEANGGTQYASDHWGVRCGLNLTPSESSQRIVESAHIVPVSLQAAPPSLSSVERLTSALYSRGVFPSEEDVAKRRSALSLLRQILIEDQTEADRRISLPSVLCPVGSYGLGVWSPSSSDIDCMVIGHVSSKTFFSVSSQRLRKASMPQGGSHDVKILRRVHARTGTMLELEVQGVKMDLQYCPAPSVADNWPSCLRLPPNDPMFALPAQTLVKLKAARDLWFLKGSLPDLTVFRLAYRTIKEWARRRGVYAARFGYLGGIHISILLSRVHKMLVATNPGAGPISATDLVVSFFAHYASFDWKKHVAFDPHFHRELRYPRNAAREPLGILGWHPPQLNTSHAASVSSTRTLAREFQRGSELLSGDAMSWDRFLGASDDTAAEFLRQYKSYVRIDVQYWGLSLSKGSSLVGWLESRCVSLLVDLNVRLPGIHARIWPGRFVKGEGEDVQAEQEDGKEEEEEEEEEEEQREYQGHYLIGLLPLPSSSTSSSAPLPMTTKEAEDKTHSTLLLVLRRFVEQIQADSRYYDENWSWVDASVVRGSKLGPLHLRMDEREWGTYLPPTAESLDSDSDGEEDDEFDDDEGVGGGGGGGGGGGEGALGKAVAGGGGGATATTSKTGAAGSSSLSHRPPKPQGAGKFRTSADVINRLRWDPGLDSSDYLVGYEDRFLGIMERSLDLWKGEQTDEEFIPQHRIVYFKRKGKDANGEAEIVWDRRTRKDVIFGSG